MESLKRSIQEDPQFMTLRALLVNPQMEVFAGNQRLRACIALGWEKVPCYVLDYTEEEQRRAMIKDNGHAGEWDQDMLANDGWDAEQLKEWGVPIDWDKPEPEEEPKELKQCKHCDKMIP
jgi:ParB-like chromosome segregation protein Spo0J